MTLCPIAIVASCKECPAFKLCPLKGVLGDHVSAKDVPASAKPDKRKTGSAKPK